MKKLPLFLLCITVFLNCTKPKDFDFEINVEQWIGAHEINQLIVTNQKGAVVKVFDNLPATNVIKEKIPYSACDPESETVDFHWVIGDQAGTYRFVYSSLGVHSGEYVLIRGEGTTIGRIDSKKVIVLVDGIPYQANGWDLEIPGLSSWNLNLPNNGNLGLRVELDINQNLYLRAKKVGTQNWVEYFVPYNQLQDTVRASISDFTLPNPFTTIRHDGVNAADLGNLQMAELSPDLKYFTVLNTTGDNAPPTSAHPGYSLPVGHTSPAAYRLYTYSYVNQKLWVIDKIFPSGQEISIQQPDVVIKGKDSKPGKNIKVTVGGDPDVVAANCYLQKDNLNFFWRIVGRPDAFLSYNLPDINAYLPSWAVDSGLFANYHVDAIRYDNLTYDEFRNGYPDRSTELFAQAKSGMVSVNE